MAMSAIALPLEDFTVPEHLQEIVHIDEFDVSGRPCYRVKRDQNQPAVRMLFLESLKPVLVTGLHFLTGFNLDCNFCVSDNGIHFLVIIGVPVGNLLSAAVIPTIGY